jgi:hypothetical protein
LAAGCERCRFRFRWRDGRIDKHILAFQKRAGKSGAT